MTTTPALAQTGNSVLTGKVQDASTKAPVADVVVTVTSPALQGEQIVVTDGSGQYRLPNLPPGDYTVRLEKESYRPYSRGGIIIRSGSTIRVNDQILPEALKAEEIVVVGRAPTVDVGSSTVGQNINQDFARRIAVAPPSRKGGATRSFESIAEVAPGAKSDTYGTSINGTTSPENSYVIDGLSVGDPAFGTVGTPLSMEFIKEVNIVTGGYMPEYGRTTGGTLDVVTKSGSNEFSGSVFFNLTPGALEGTRSLIRRDGTTITTNPTLSSIRDYGVELGGPIIKDKLWFYGGLDLAFTSRNLRRNLSRIREFDQFGEPVTDPNTGFTQVDPLSGTERTYRAESRSTQFLGKLTYQIDQDHSVALSFTGTPSVAGGNGAFAIDPQTGNPEVNNIAGTFDALASRQIADAYDVALKWSSAFNNKRVLLDVTLGWHTQYSATLPTDGSELGTREGLAGVPAVVWRRTTPTLHSITDFENVPDGCTPETRTVNVDADGDGVPDVDATGQTLTEEKTLLRCPVTGYTSGGPGFIDEQVLNRYAIRAVVTTLFEGLGHHVVKVGFDGDITSYGHTKAYSGREVFRESLTGTTFSDFRMYGFLTGPEIGDYVIQDKVQVNSNSLVLGGFIQDSWSILDKVTLNAGVRYDVQYLINDAGAVGMALPNQWSPRVGVVYDFTQEGRSKLFANYARYYQNVPLNIVDRSFGDERQLSSNHTSTTHPNVAGDPSQGCDPTDVEDALGTGPGQCQFDGDENNVANRRRRAGAVARTDPNKYWVPTGAGSTPVDPDIKPASSDELVLGAEYEVIPNGRVGAFYTKRWMNDVIEDMSVDEASTYFIGNPGSGIGQLFPTAERDYDAGTVYFNKGFADGWLAQVSYTISYLRGNYAGLFRPETGQLDPNITSDFDLVSLLANRTGPLPGDRRHEIKAFAAKDIEITNQMALNVGLGYRSRSGAPTNYFGSHILYGADEAFLVPRGSGERLGWEHSLDGRIGYTVNLAKQSQLTLTLDIFNLFNFQAITGIDQRYTSADVLPCPNGKVSDLKQADGTSCLRKIDPDTGEAVDFDVNKDVNPNFGNPTAFQDPRTFRFGARVTF